MPAGHIEKSENPRQAAVREALEESGVQIDPKDLKMVRVIYRHSNRTYADFVFVAETWQGEPRNAEPIKCDQVGFFDFNALPKNILPYIKETIEDLDHPMTYAEFGF